MKKTLIVALAMAFTAPAFAQVTTSPPADATVQDGKMKDGKTKAATFSKIDADLSGSLTLSEVKMHEASVSQADFDKYDVDKSKSLSMAEFDTWQEDSKEKTSPTAG